MKLTKKLKSILLCAVDSPVVPSPVVPSPVVPSPVTGVPPSPLFVTAFVTVPEGPL